MSLNILTPLAPAYPFTEFGEPAPDPGEPVTFLYREPGTVSFRYREPATVSLRYSEPGTVRFLFREPPGEEG